jgi:integrase
MKTVTDTLRISPLNGSEFDEMRHKRDTGEMAPQPIPNPADPIRDRRHIKLIKNMLTTPKKREQLLMFVIGINSGLRVSDLLQLTYGDLWKKDGTPRKEFSQRAQKTGSFVVTKINSSIREARDYYA